MSVASESRAVASAEMELERNPGKLREAAEGQRAQFVEAADADGVWRSAAYWARKDRGVRLRNAQRLAGDLELGDDGRSWVVVSDRGAPWIASLIGRHGTYSTYVNWECRCDPCLGAHEEYGSDYRMGVR